MTGKGQEKITIPDSYIPADYKPASYKPHKPTVFADADEYEIKLENKYDYYQSKPSDGNTLKLPVIYRDFIGFDKTGTGNGYITKEQAELYGSPFVAGRGHPDFMPAKTTDFRQIQLGMVSSQLGGDGFPVLLEDTSSFRPENQLTKKSFDMWFKDYPGINTTIKKDLELILSTNGGWIYSSHPFLPLSENEGYGKETSSQNINFTLVMNFYLNYTGNEILTFGSDDDMWVFINGKLAYDCGGLHAKWSQSIRLSDTSKIQILQNGETIEYKYDENYDIVEGQRVEIKIFKAERFYGGSTFEIKSTTDLFERRMKTE